MSTPVKQYESGIARLPEVGEKDRLLAEANGKGLVIERQGSRAGHQYRLPGHNIVIFLTGHRLQEHRGSACPRSVSCAE